MFGFAPGLFRRFRAAITGGDGRRDGLGVDLGAGFIGRCVAIPGDVRLRDFNILALKGAPAHEKTGDHHKGEEEGGDAGFPPVAVIDVAHDMAEAKPSRDLDAKQAEGEDDGRQAAIDFISGPHIEGDRRRAGAEEKQIRAAAIVGGFVLIHGKTLLLRRAVRPC